MSQDCEKYLDEMSGFSAEYDVGGRCGRYTLKCQQRKKILGIADGTRLKGEMFMLESILELFNQWLSILADCKGGTGRGTGRCWNPKQKILMPGIDARNSEVCFVCFPCLSQLVVHCVK